MHHLSLLLFTILLAACGSKPETNRNDNGHNSPAAKDTAVQQPPAVPQPVTDTSALSQITPFTANETNTVFTAPGGWEASAFESGDRIAVQKNGQAVGNIDLHTRPYDGPGFALYHFATQNGKGRSVLLAEAQADSGTAWYCAAIMENDRIVKQYFIDEPRSNSEEHTLGDYLHIFETGGKLMFRFNKKLIAAYSKIPAAMRQDANYTYLEYGFK